MSIQKLLGCIKQLKNGMIMSLIVGYNFENDIPVE